MTILGIDPGTMITGYAIGNTELELIDYGHLNLEDEKRMPGKLKQFNEFFYNIILDYTPDVIALETPFLGRNPRTFMSLGYLRGMVYFMCNEHTILEFSPSEAKKIVTGSGRSTKDDVARVVCGLWPELVDERNDVTDAASLVVCAAKTLNFNKE